MSNGPVENYTRGLPIKYVSISERAEVQLLH